MESQGAEVHTLAPENLPPPIDPVFKPQIFDRTRKIELIAGFIKSGLSTAQYAASLSEELGVMITPAQFRGWSYAYNVQATKLLKERAGVPEPPPKPPPLPKPANTLIDHGMRYTNAQRRQFLARYYAMGEGLLIAARKLNVSRWTLARWIEADTESKKEAKQVEQTTKKPKAKTRRVFSDAEKILYAVRYKKFGIDNWMEGGKRLGVSASAISRWVRDFDKLKPQQKAAVKNAEHGHIGDDVKRQAIAEIDAGVTAMEVAAKYGVHRDSIKNWYLKTGRKWPNQWQLKVKTGTGSKIRADSRTADAVARVEAGELISNVAASLGATPGTIRHWWIAVNGKRPWPNQYRGGGPKVKVKNPYGPQKRTIARRDLVQTAAGELINAPEELNGVAQPISTGKATHDAIVFLRLARDEYTKGIKAGTVRIDDPIMLFSMLALHTLGR